MLTFQWILRILFIGMLFCIPYGIIMYINKKDRKDGRIKRIEREIVRLSEESYDEK